MNSNIRFFLLIVFFAALVAGLWLLLGSDNSETVPVPREIKQAPIGVSTEARSSDPQSPVQHDTGTGNVEKKSELFGASVGRTRERDSEKPAPVRRQPTGKGVIRGRVLDSKRSAVADATVTLIAEEGDETVGRLPIVYQNAVQTDAEGNYAATELPVNKSYQLKATSPTGFSVLRTYLSAGKPEIEMDFTLTEGGAIEGWVGTDAGKPIAGAVLYPSQKEGRQGGISGERGKELRSVTDAEGGFALYTEPGSWRLFVKAEGYATTETPFFRTGTRGVKIVLGTGGSVSGNVVHQKTGRPLPNVSVLVESKVYWQNTYKGTTDAEGKFRIETLQDGDYIINVTDNTYGSTGGPVSFSVRRGQETTGLILRATGGGPSTGR